MPTFEWLPAFGRDLRHLSAMERDAFDDAVAQFVTDLSVGGNFTPGLRVKKMKGRDGVWEMSWAADGRATFAFGEPIREGERHIVWRRVGGHDIFKDA